MSILAYLTRGEGGICTWCEARQRDTIRLLCGCTAHELVQLDA
jgi:hypothetical protein